MDFVSSETLAELYNCNPKDYKGIGIEKLIIASTRVLNCLRRHNIFYVDELLNCTGEEILGINNWGRKCSEDLDAALCDFFKSFNDEINDKEELRLVARTGMFKLLENNTKYSHETIQKYREARELLGPELVISILDGDPYIKVIFEMASKFCLNVNKNHYLDILVSEIPKSRLNTSFKKLGSIYSRNDVNFELESENDENLSSFIEKNILAYVNNDYRIKRFIDWCRYDLNSELDRYIVENVRERDYEVLRCRIDGMTLEEVGNKQEVTRERIRQIEKKVIKQLHSWFLRNRFFDRLLIDLNAESFVSCDRIKDLLENNGDIVSFIYQHVDAENYFKDLNGFVLNHDKYMECREYVDDLPETINEKDLEQVLTRAEDELNEHDDLIKTIIASEYRKTGDIFHKSRLTLANIYSDVLKTHFQQGIHISDEQEISQFKKYVFNDYGIELKQNNRAIGSVIGRVGILCDRGIYKFNSGSFISENLLNRVYEYIVNNDAPALLTNTVFSEFEDELIPEGINNKYFLQGVLHDVYRDKLYFRRDYISKDNSFVNLYTQINDYIEQFDVPVDKAQIFEAFPGVTEIIVNIATSEENIINLFGSYIHATKLKISDADVQYLHSVVQRAVEKRKSIHCKSIFYYIKKDNPTVLSNNYMFQSFCCYSVLEYLFREEYTFDRPYIAKLGTEIERSSDVITKLIVESEVLEISELLAKSRQLHYFIQNSLEFIDTCNDTHLLLDREHIAKIKYIGVSEREATMIEEMIDQEDINGTVAISSLKCFQTLPKINTPWSDWLVYSVINKWSTKYEVAASSNQLRQAVPLIAKAGELDENIDVDYNEEVYFADDLSNIDDLIGDILIEDIEGI